MSQQSKRSKSVKELASPGPGLKFPKVVAIHSERKHLSMGLSLKQLGTCIEAILSFHVFLKHGGSLITGKDAAKDYHRSLCSMLHALTVGVQRADGSRQFKLQKFLECSHFLEDHILYGPPCLHNSDTGERGLKSWAKHPAITAQKRDAAPLN